MSGTSRQKPLEAAQGDPEDSEPRTCSPAAASLWYPGIDHICEMPPPPAPPWPDSPTTEPLFQTDSLGAGPGLLSVVPPVPVTNGLLAGSSTASDRFGGPGGGPLQSSEPSSPDAETIV